MAQSGIAAGPGAMLLGSLQEGTNYVPQTGTYELHQGEAVVPAHQNSGGGSGAVDQSKQQLQQLVQQIMQRARQPQQQSAPPTSRFSPRETQQQGYDMSHNTGAADIGQALGNFGVFVNNMVAQHKENQVNDATGVWRKLSQAHENAIAAAGEGDPKDPAYQKKITELMAADPLTADLNPAKNPKAMKHIKNMKEAFNYNLVDGPDAENVYHMGLKRHFKIQDAFKKMVGAKKKMEEHKQGGQGGQQPPSQEQQMSAFQGVLGMFNKQSTATSEADPKQAMEAARIGQAQQSLDQDKLTFQQGVGPDGKATWFAFDKAAQPGQPPKGRQVEMDGKPIGAISKFSQAQNGKVVSVEGKPYGVIGEHGVVTPADPEWSEKEGRKYDSANKAYATAEANKQKLAGIRANTYLSSREYPVLDKEGVLRYRNANELNAHPDLYSPATGGIAAMGKESVFQDIYYNADNVKEAVGKLKGGFDAKTRAEFILAMRSTDPKESFSTFMSSEAGKLVSKDEDKVNYLTAIASLAENAMAMRAIGGFGQGSQDLREAILRTIPGAGTSSKAYAYRQLQLFKGTVDRLHKGVPSTVVGKDGDEVIDISH